MWLLLPVLVISLLFLALLAGLVYGFYRLTRVIPGITRLIHNYILLVQSKVNQIANLAVEPFLKVHSAAAGLKAIKKNFSK